MAEIKNLRFGVMITRDQRMPISSLIMLTIRGEIDGKTYGASFHPACVNGEVPAEEFVAGVNMLQERMRQLAEGLQEDKSNG